MTPLTNLKIWMLERKISCLNAKIAKLKVQALALFEEGLVGSHIYKLNHIDEVERKIKSVQLALDNLRAKY